jgi:hypothetical protein
MTAMATKRAKPIKRKNPIAAALAHMKWDQLSAAERSAAARKASQARWGKSRKRAT